MRENRAILEKKSGKYKFGSNWEEFSTKYRFVKFINLGVIDVK